MKRTVAAASVAAVAALAALGGCSKKTETAATGTAAPASASVSGPISLPARKAGLWEMKISTAGIHQTMKQCLDEAVDRQMKWWGSQSPKAGKTDCAEERISAHLGGGWDFHAVCKMGESGTITTDGTATGDSSHYRMEANSVTTGSPMPQANGPHKTSIEGAWTGPCPADMKPGDMEMAGGVKFNAHGGPGGGPSVVTGPGGVDMAKLRAQAMSGHMDPAEMAKLRAQAKAMEAAAKQSQ